MIDIRNLLRSVIQVPCFVLGGTSSRNVYQTDKIFVLLSKTTDLNKRVIVFVVRLEVL